MARFHIATVTPTKAELIAEWAPTQPWGTPDASTLIGSYRFDDPEGRVGMNKQINATATGDLTLHGVTKQVTFDVTAERVAGQIKVNGTIPVHFSDYSINNPSGGPAQVGNDGTLEFTLVFTR